MNDEPAKSSDGKFRPGQSGNPSGRRAGSRNKATLAAESLLDGQAEALTQKAIDAALGGDLAALRICLERIYPPRKSRPIQITLPDTTTADGVSKAHTSVIAAVADGDITPEEGNSVAAMLEARRKSIETVELEGRLSKLEEQRK